MLKAVATMAVQGWLGCNYSLFFLGSVNSSCSLCQQQAWLMLLSLYISLGEESAVFKQL